MKMFLQKRKRKGFTLVELLIVIIIIGILASSMMLVMGAGRDKAEATKIVSNLRSLKSAAIMCYADNNVWPSAISSLDDYMDASLADYTVTLVSEDCWLGTTVSDDSGVAKKLQKMREDGDIPLYLATTSTSPDYAAGPDVYMKVQ